MLYYFKIKFASKCPNDDFYYMFRIYIYKYTFLSSVKRGDIGLNLSVCLSVESRAQAIYLQKYSMETFKFQTRIEHQLKVYNVVFLIELMKKNGKNDRILKIYNL